MDNIIGFLIALGLIAIFVKLSIGALIWLGPLGIGVIIAVILLTD